MAKKVFEYWSPKTGINKAGIKLLNENMITLSANSTKEDIRLYIEKQTKKNLVAITEAYRSGMVNMQQKHLNQILNLLLVRNLRKTLLQIQYGTLFLTVLSQVLIKMFLIN